MARRFLKNPRPLAFALAAMVFLCGVLLVLYLFARKENTLLKTARSEQFLALAAGEAEAALTAWENDSPTAEVYHRITSAAAYLTMAAPTEENGDLVLKLRTAGELLLQGEMLPADTEVILQTAMYGRREIEPAEMKENDKEENGRAPMPWADMPVISRREGLKLAEKMTQAERILHPAHGKNLVYTCRNVYVRLSGHGGVPLEMAVYTPSDSPPSYPEEECAVRSSRFLERYFPRSLRTDRYLSMEDGGSFLRFLYPCGTGQMQIDVRTDTGRITGVQILPADEKEQSLTEKDCSYIGNSGKLRKH